MLCSTKVTRQHAAAKASWLTQLLLALVRARTADPVFLGSSRPLRRDTSVLENSHHEVPQRVTPRWRSAGLFFKVIYATVGALRGAMLKAVGEG